MSNRITYHQCPFCNSPRIRPALSATDHTVSKETFDIWHCDDCTNRFTQHVPDEHAIGIYYQSAAYISHSDTRKGWINRLYHRVRNYTLRGKTTLLQSVTGKQTGRLLDIGAGTGAFAHIMKSAGWEVTGLEPDTVARRHALDKHGLVLQSPEKLFQFQEEMFDAITMWHVLEHVHDLDGYWDQFAKRLAPGGKLVIAVPNYTSHDASVYEAYWAAYDVPRHLYHFSPAGMELLANAKGFRLETVKPMWFDSFYVSMLSEQYKNGKGNFLRAVWNGLVSNLKAIVDQKKASSLIYIFSLVKQSH